MKLLKAWPVVALLGPRQSGKSTFLKDLVWKSGTVTLLSLDSAAVRRRAEESPELLLSEVAKYPLVIDEAHKAPALFDEIKAIVDARRIPGRFVISGSVQFSKKTGIRESLTGRVATVRMDPMTLLETGPKKVTLASINDYLQLGGMPGVCFFRDKDMRDGYWEQWLDTTCERDLKMFSTGRLSGDLARRILEKTAVLELPSASELARELRVDARRIHSHLNALEALFVLNSIEPSQHGVGKTLFYPFDAGLAAFLGAGLQRKWQIWFLSEWMNQRRFSGEHSFKKPQYYRSTRGSFVDFVTDELVFHLFSDLPFPDRRAKQTVQAILKKRSKFSVKIYSATDQEGGKFLPKAVSVPWKSIVKPFLSKR